MNPGKIKVDWEYFLISLLAFISSLLIIYLKPKTESNLLMTYLLFILGVVWWVAGLYAIKIEEENTQ